MENSKQRLQQKSLWQAVNLLSQPPCAYSLHPHQAKPPGPLMRRAAGPQGTSGHKLDGYMTLTFFYASVV